MARPTNQEMYDREPELEAGSEAVVAAVQAAHPEHKIIEAEVDNDPTTGAALGYEVTSGWVDADGTTYHILESTFDADGTLTGEEERPNVPPGQAKEKHDKPDKKEKPLKARKPHAKVKGHH